MQGKIRSITILTLTISVIGAAAWLPFLFEIWTKPEVCVKINAFACSKHAKGIFPDPRYEKSEVVNGIGYYIHMRMTSLKREFNVSNIIIEAIYDNDPKVYEGLLFNVPKIVLCGENEPDHILNIPREENHNSLLLIPKDIVIPLWLTFIVKKDIYKEFSEIRIIFESFNGKKQIVPIHQQDINARVMSYDPFYFTPIDS